MMICSNEKKRATENDAVLHASSPRLTESQYRPFRAVADRRTDGRTHVETSLVRTRSSFRLYERRSYVTRVTALDSYVLREVA